MRIPVLAALLALALPASALASTPSIQAHRGGSISFTKPVYPENTMPGFIHAAKLGFTVEFDVKLTKDRVPVVIHDATLDRTTRCKGNVKDFTLKQIQTKCKSDVLGAPDSTRRTRLVRPTIPVPTLAAVLKEMKKLGARVSMEIKNYPTDPQDFDNFSGKFANRVMDTVLRSKFPRKHLIVQSFFPQNLMVARQRLPHVATSQLVLAKTSASTSISLAKASDATIVSPGWPIDRAYVKQVHAAGFKVIPYTLDDRRFIRTAAKIGCDALITNDPLLARRTLR